MTKKKRATRAKSSGPKANGSTKGKKTQQARPEATTKAKKAPPKEDLVVFAFRLTPEERNAIHKAAGPGKASRFVRALATAASRADEKTVSEMVKAVRESTV